MTFTVINEDWTGGSPRLTLLAEDTAFVGYGVDLVGTGSHVLVASSADTSIHISAGARLHSDAGTIFMDGVTEANKSLTIENTAVVSSLFYGVLITGNNFSVTNAGQINGSSYGIITQISDSSHVGTVVNTGQIVGGSVGVIFNGADRGTIELENSGLIWGGNASVRATVNLQYEIVNRGELRGAVQLGDLSDSVDNVGGLVRGTISLGGGIDVLRPGARIEVADGGNENDLLDFSGSGTVRVSLTNSATNAGAAAGDTYTAFENITGSLAGSDRLEGDGLANTLLGLGGNDSLYGLGNSDSLEGGSGNDLLDGGIGADTMLGGAGDDTYYVDSATDRVYETTTAVSGINAGGVDRVISSVTRALDAFVENLTLSGSSNLFGSGNVLNNSITGNTGSNTLNGLLGNDTLTGGLGVDRFVFNTALSSTNIDRVTDFAAGTDEIRLENAIFVGLSAGTLLASRFVSNATGLATNTSQRIIYENDTGKVFFDADGSGAGVAKQFALLQAGLVLTNSDFFVI